VSVMTVDPFEREGGKDAALWTAAAVVVAALHVGLAAAYLLLRPAPEGQAEAPVIDVAFMPAASAPAAAAPEAPPAEPTPPVEQSDLGPVQDKQVETRDAVTEPEPPPAKIEPSPLPQITSPPVALQVPEPAAEPARPDELTVMPPPPKAAEPVPQAKPENVPERPPHKRAADEKAEREKAEREATEKQKHKAAPPRRAAAPGSTPRQLAMAPNPGADSEGASAGRASWESELAAHIRRYATYAANGNRESGTVRVGVTIDRNGRLLSHRLAGSSGSAVLDSAAMAVIERAQPYPRFPPGMTQAQIALTIPLHLRPQ
jgi:periplasmic protein TonB